MKTFALIPLAALVASLNSQAQELPPLRVTATLPAAAAELPSLSGGTNLIQPQQSSRLSTLKDALAHQPGLIVQEFFGGIDQPRLNIRGSGIQSNPVNRGVLLLEDGLPLNEADGSFVMGTLEPRDAQAIIVKRGANAREPGATTLGGSLNFIPQYGRQSPNQLRLEAGSFARGAGQLVLNQHNEQHELHLGLSVDHYGGYRHHSSGERQALRLNLGSQLTPNWHSRLYINHTNLDFEIPFVIPKERLSSQPKGVMGDGNTPQDNLLNVYKRDPHRRTEQWRLAEQLTWTLNEQQQHQFGFYVQDTQDSFVDPLSHADTNTLTYGLQWQWDTSQGDNDWRLSSSWDSSDMQRQYHASNPQNGTQLQRFADLDMQASNLTLAAQWQRPLVAGWQLDSQVRQQRACRQVQDRQSAQQIDRCWNGGTATLGFVHQGDTQRWYANLSSSREAPTFWEMVGVTVAPNNPAQAKAELTPLQPQRALTLELGGTGQLTPWLNWDISLYRSEVEDEIITQADMVGGRGVTSNYSDDTLHQGMELGLQGGERLHYRLAWTYSDFRFLQGSYAGKRIAGIPEHLLSAQLGYRLPLADGQLDISTQLHWQPQDTPIDHLNSLYQDSFAVWGLTLDYQPDQAKWRAFVQVDNLFDKRYASSYVIRNQSLASQPSFLPGNGRSLSAGLRIPF